MTIEILLEAFFPDRESMGNALDGFKKSYAD